MFLNKCRELELNTFLTQFMTLSMNKSAIVSMKNNAALATHKNVKQFSMKFVKIPFLLMPLEEGMVLLINPNAKKLNDRSVTMFLSASVILFPNNRVPLCQKLFQDKSVHLFRSRNANQFPKRFVTVFPGNNATVFQGNSVNK